MTIVTRQGLGRPLTWEELDSNFESVDSLAEQASVAVSEATNQAQAAQQAATQAVDASTSAQQSAQQAATEVDTRIQAFETTLNSTDGGDEVGFKMNSTSATPTTLQQKNYDVLTFDDFIPQSMRANTANINCAPYIQAGIKEAFASHREICGVAGKVYGVSNTILIPQNFDNTFANARAQVINGNGCTFNMLTDVILFESGYYNGSGQLVTNFGTEADSHYSKYISLGNFTIVTSVPGGRLSSALLRIQDWHHASRIHDIFCNCASFGMHSQNNYYTEFDNLCFEYPITNTGDRYVFSGFHNLNVFRRLIATNAQIQYRFDGPITACVFDSISMEGCNVGIQFSSTVYDVLVHNSYIENVEDVAVFFNDYSYSVRFENNYVNFVTKPNMYFIGYRGTPITEIYVDRSNHFNDMPDDSHIIKGSAGAVYGVGITIDRAPALSNDLRSLMVDNSKIGTTVDVRQRKIVNGVIGNVVNNLIPGNYAGKFTSGLDGKYGFTWVNFGTPTLLLKTALLHNNAEFIYVNINVTYAGGTKRFRGFFMDAVYVSVSSAGVTPSSELALNLDDNPYVQIQATLPGIVTDVQGEIRLI